MRYRQLMVVSVIAAHASDGDYAAMPRGMNLLCESRSRRQRQPQPQALASGVLTMTGGRDHIDDAHQPAVEYLYTAD